MPYLTVRQLEQSSMHRVRKDSIEVTTSGVTQEYRKNKRNLQAVSAHRQNEYLRAFHEGLSKEKKGVNHA
jgi:hypothetical protein